MITFKIYFLKNFEETHTEYFQRMLNILKEKGYLCTNIEEIIITDDYIKEIERYSVNLFQQPKLTADRDVSGIAKTINFDKKKKVFFDARHVNSNSFLGTQVFYEQLLYAYTDELISILNPTDITFYSDTPLVEIVKIFFAGWSKKIISRYLRINIEFDFIKVHSEVKIHVNAFKRNIRKTHYKYQEDVDLVSFWIHSLEYLDAFVNRCIDVKSDNGNFERLQEFEEIIPPLLLEIEKQALNLINREDVYLLDIESFVLKVLEKCYINVQDKKRIKIGIIENPKKIFKGNLIDTEPRIVAFIDILGFSAIVNEYETDRRSNLLNELHEALETAVKTSIENIVDTKAKSDLKEFLEYRMFSDCLCISLPYIEFDNDFHIQFQSLALVVHSYQTMMMHKGFFVRGGISIGSYFSDKNMIFSEGLVKAHKIEQEIVNPIIGIDKLTLERLGKNYKENSKGLFYEEMFLYNEKDPSKIFLNPFDILDNVGRSINYIQSSLDGLVNTNDDSDPISKLTNSLLKMTTTFVNPIFNYAKSQITPNNINLAKEELLGIIDVQIQKHQYLLSDNRTTEENIFQINKVISKYVFLKSLTEWSIDKTKLNDFHFYSFIQNK